jgi:ABC-type multidrug transport system ATPase subunit
MIQVREVTKRYGAKTAVDHLSFTAKPGQVTGFLGPNGAGKSTTMRMIVDLDAPKHVGRVLAKIGARDRIQAVIFAYDNGLVQPRA